MRVGIFIFFVKWYIFKVRYLKNNFWINKWGIEVDIVFSYLLGVLKLEFSLFFVFFYRIILELRIKYLVLGRAFVVVF